MKIIKILPLVLLLTSFAFAQSKWKGTTYSVVFKIKHVAGSTADGKFSGLKSIISFDKENLANASISATLDANTFNTGNGSRDKTLKGEEYFNVQKFPLISMKSVRITSKGGDNYEGMFRLTIKDVTKEIPLKFTVVITGNKAVFASEFIINRLDYGVGDKSWMLSNDATVNILLNAEKE